jgi:hypothetical protein
MKLYQWFYKIFLGGPACEAGLSTTHLGLHLSTHAEKETRNIQYGPLLLFQ